MFKKLSVLLMFTFSLFAHQGQIARANNIEIWHETFGNKENPAVLLIMGACCQGVLWDTGFCEKLAEEGFYVIRYDHRDAGESTCFDFESEPYDLFDMAKDASSLLKEIGVEKAHLFGVSMGGFVAEVMAAYFSEQVHSILILGSTCDNRHVNLTLAGSSPEENSPLSPPTQEYLDWMLEFMKLSAETDEEKLNERLEAWNQLNGKKIPLDVEINQRIHKTFLSRLRYPQGMVNHITMLRGTLSEALVATVPYQVKVPTIILQGSEDPIYPPDHGMALAKAIPHAEHFLVEGMGHIPNDRFYDFYIDLLKKQAAN